MKIRFIRPARLELREAREYYESLQIGLGDELLLEVEAALTLIFEWPHSWQRIGETSRRCLIHRFPYELIYSIEDEEIVIVAFAHLHRNPDYWRDRL